MTIRPRRLSALPRIGPAVVTMGVFDGVHLGHRHLLEATLGAARRLAAASVALVFEPHPDEVLHPGTTLPRLAPLAENLRRIRAAGIGHAVPIRFDDDLRALSAEEFVAGLGPRIQLRGVVMTPSSAFGRGRGGTPARLREIGTAAGFDVIEVEPLLIDGEPVSSSRLRAALASGDLPGLRRMGGIPYLEGTVVHGDGRGRALGVPTANLRFSYAALLPPHGVWAARVQIVGIDQARDWPALVSIGTRPTTHRAGRVVVEAHLLDRSDDLYGARLGVELVAFLREQRRFGSEAELVDQMVDDLRVGRGVLERA